MRHGLDAVACGLAMLSALVFATPSAAAGSAVAGHGAAAGIPTFAGHLDIRPGGFFAHPTAGHRFQQPHGLAPHQFDHRNGFDHRHRFFHRPFAGFVASPGVIYVAPPLDYGVDATAAAPIYDVPDQYSSPVLYTQPMATAAIAPAPPPPPTVVEYATGRYELRGDGVTVPYTWQWVANVPPPPPPPPAAPPAPVAAPPAEKKPARQAHLYRWVDDQNVVYWTDNLESIPEEYRARVKQMPVR